MAEEKEEKLPIYELKIEDIDFDSVTAISIVDYPAIESDFMKFNINKKNRFEFGKADEEKRIITGAALIPDKMIYRFDMFKGEYEVFFSSETIKQISKLYLKQHKQDSVTIQHEYNANNIYMFESWIVEDPNNDKSNALGFEDLPAGTWMISMHVDNDEVWEQIKNEEIKGFSIEAFISTILTDLVKVDLTDDEQKIKEIKDLIDIWLKN